MRLVDGVKGLFLVDGPEGYVACVGAGDEMGWWNDGHAVDGIFRALRIFRASAAENELGFVDDFPESCGAVARANADALVCHHGGDGDNVVLVTEEGFDVGVASSAERPSLYRPVKGRREELFA